MVFMVPVTELLWLGLSFRAAAVIGTLLALLVILLLPVLERLREPNAWWAPLFALVLGGGLLGMGIRAAAPTSARPAPSTLALAFDHGTSESLWLTDTSEEPVDSAAEAWAVSRAGAAFEETRSLERFGYAHFNWQGESSTDARVTAGPQVEAPLPEVWALSDTVLQGSRRLRLAVRSRIGAELIEFLFPEGGGTRLTAVNGRSVPAESVPTRVEHWGTPDPVVILDLEMAEGTQPEMDVVEHLLRPQELVGPEPFQRVPELAPDIVWKSDRAMIRTPAASLEIMPGPPPFSLEPTPRFGTPVGHLGPPEVSPDAMTPGADSVPSADTVPADTATTAADVVTVP
jgi:hypothetical protein